MYKQIFATFAVFCVSSTCLQAQNVNFLNDYSKLTDGSHVGFTKAYVNPEAKERIKNIAGVMIDLPELFIDPNSKYKGIKPGDAIVVGGELREAMIRGIEESVPVVDEPGDNVDLVSWAVTNLRVEKKRRGVLGYTPVGAVAYGVKKQLSDVVDKTKAFDVVFEVEATDLDSGEVLFAMVLDLEKAGIKAEWENALALAEGLGRRIGCQVKNSKLPENEQAACEAISITN